MKFHLIESQAPLIARMMVLMDILINNSEEHSVQDKSEKYLEVFGNLFLRQKTWDFVEERSLDLIRVITDGKGALADIFDCRHLKFKEKDDLEFVFKFWRDPKKKFDVATMW